jgi:hypothetical protein
VPVKVTGAEAVARNYRKYWQQYASTTRTVLSREAETVEARLKHEAPWQDRTGNARRGLHAGVLEPAHGQFTLRAAHGDQVPYGIYLETAHQGRYAVLWPVLRTQWPRTLRRVAAEIKRIKL